jgi:hypothetical protein
MLSLSFGLGLVVVAVAVVVARFRTRSHLWILFSLLFRFSCLLIGTAATAYWAAAPGGPHPISACGSAFLLAYVVSGDSTVVRIPSRSPEAAASSHGEEASSLGSFSS